MQEEYKYIRESPVERERRIISERKFPHKKILRWVYYLSTPVFALGAAVLFAVNYGSVSALIFIIGLVIVFVLIPLLFVWLNRRMF